MKTRGDRIAQIRQLDIAAHVGSYIAGLRYPTPNDSPEEITEDGCV